MVISLPGTKPVQRISLLHSAVAEEELIDHKHTHPNVKQMVDRAYNTEDNFLHSDFKVYDYCRSE